MKQLLLVAAIHLLILHQYTKDKKETLAPKKDLPAKMTTPEYPGYWALRKRHYTNDSLQLPAFRHQPVSYPNLYLSYYYSR